MMLRSNDAGPKISTPRLAISLRELSLCAFGISGNAERAGQGRLTQLEACLHILDNGRVQFNTCLYWRKSHLRRVAMYDTAAQVNDLGSVVACCDIHISFCGYAWTGPTRTRMDGIMLNILQEEKCEH